MSPFLHVVPGKAGWAHEEEKQKGVEDGHLEDGEEGGGGRGDRTAITVRSVMDRTLVGPSARTSTCSFPSACCLRCTLTTDSSPTCPSQPHFKWWPRSTSQYLSFAFKS